MNTLNNIIPSPLLINLTLNSNYATSKYATSDFNGKENTKMLSNIDNNSEMYVAGLGELGIIMENISYINNIIKEYHGNIISYNAKYASSTFYYENNVFNKNYDIFNNVNNVWVYDTYNGKISYENISNNFKTLSIYKYDIKDFDSTEDDYDDVSVNYLKINNEHKDEFDISSYLFYSQDDLLDNLENTLTYNFFKDSLNKENQEQYSKVFNSNAFAITQTDQKILKDYYNYYKSINIFKFENKFKDLYYKITEDNIDKYYKVDIINNVYNQSSGEVTSTLYTSDMNNFYTLENYRNNTSTNFNGLVVIDENYYNNIYNVKFYKDNSTSIINVIDSNDVIIDNETIIVDNYDSFQTQIKTILEKYKIAYDVNNNNTYRSLDNYAEYLRYYADYNSNEQSFYITPIIDNNFYINYNLINYDNISNNYNKIRIKINFIGLTYINDQTKDYYNPSNIIVEFTVKYITNKNSIILNLKKNNEEIPGNFNLYGDIWENNNHIQDFLYTLIVTFPYRSDVDADHRYNYIENFSTTLSVKGPEQIDYFGFKKNIGDDISTLLVLENSRFINKTYNGNYVYYEASFYISLLKTNNNDINSDFKGYLGNDLKLILYFNGNDQYNAVTNQISVKILNCESINSDNEIYFYDALNNNQKIDAPIEMKYSDITDIQLYVGDNFVEGERENIYYSSNNIECLKVNNTLSNNLSGKLSLSSKLEKGQMNGQVIITAEIKGNYYQRKSTSITINYIYFDKPINAEFNDISLITNENNMYVLRIGGTHSRINEGIVDNKSCKYFEIDFPTFKQNDQPISVDKNTLTFSLVGDTNDSTSVFIDSDEYDINYNVAFCKINSNNKIQINVIFDQDLTFADNSGSKELILYLKTSWNQNIQNQYPAGSAYLKIILTDNFKLTNNELVMGIKSMSSLRDIVYGDGENINFRPNNYYQTININFDYSYYVYFTKDNSLNYLIDTNNTYILNNIPRNVTKNDDQGNQYQTYSQYTYTITTNSGIKNLLVNSYYINIGHIDNDNTSNYYENISAVQFENQLLEKTNIIEYPIYDQLNNELIKIYSMPLLPSRKIDNYYDCEFYIVIPKLLIHNKKYTINQIYNNLKINIKFGNGEIKKVLSPYKRLNDCVIYKYQGIDLYDSNHIQNQELIITILDLSKKDSIEDQIVYSQKIFFNLFELKVEQGKYQNIDAQLRYSNYYPLKYPLRDTKKRYIELNYIPYDNINKYAIDDLKKIEIGKKKYIDNFKYDYDTLSFNYSYLNSNIIHKIDQSNIYDWFINENGNGLMVDKSSYYNQPDKQDSIFNAYISNIESSQYNLDKFEIYFI